MNFLGHLYFSNNDVQLQYANLFGDFVKGTDFSNFPIKIQEGIHLHRTIDNYIDHHPVVLELLHKLYPELPKIAGIAVDLYFDHLLALKWENYHDLPLRTFVNHFYNAEIENREHYTTPFLITIERMKQYDWLFQYRTVEGLERVCNGLSHRISFDNALINGVEVFQKHEEAITAAFYIYMNDATVFFKNYFETANQF